MRAETCTCRLCVGQQVAEQIATYSSAQQRQYAALYASRAHRAVCRGRHCNGNHEKRTR